MRRDGFTLIELAVVLVIIGLLVGGVLVGRDLLKAATVKKFTATMDKFSAGAGTFRLKYKSLPGDLMPSDAGMYGFTARSGNLGQGDGNGIIEGCSQQSQRLGCETALFWRDMWDGHVSPIALEAATNIPVDGTVGGFRLEGYLPPTPFRTNTSLFMYALNSRNSYYVGRVASVGNDGTMTMAPALTPQEAKDIDDKLDDTAPDNGTVRAMSDLSTYDMGAAPSDTTCVNNTLDHLAYNLAEDYSANITCQLSIRNQL